MSSFNNMYRYKAFKIFGVIFTDRSLHSDALAAACAIYGEEVVEKALDNDQASFGMVYQDRHDYASNKHNNLCAMDIHANRSYHKLNTAYEPGDGNYGNLPFGKEYWNNTRPEDIENRMKWF